MKRIFLSLGFNKRPEKIVRDTINEAKKKLTSYCENEDVEFVHNYDYIGNNSVECLGEAIKKMSTCDIVCFINDWDCYTGCTVEHDICEFYNIPRAYIAVSI